MHKRILVVEDDLALAEGLCRALTAENTLLDYCGTIQKAREYLTEKSPSLILLDVNLPDGSGFDFLKEIKESYQIPVILLTVNDMETDIVTGLEMGADDYITKPFSLAVLRARVNTQLRRITEEWDKDMGKTCDKIQEGDYIFDFGRMEFFYKGERVELSKTEQKLLKMLVENKGLTLTREVLTEHIWTCGYDFVDENALSVCIKRLRDKLHAGGCIQTVYGIGYVWRESDE